MLLSVNLYIEDKIDIIYYYPDLLEIQSRSDITSKSKLYQISDNNYKLNLSFNSELSGLVLSTMKHYLQNKV